MVWFIGLNGYERERIRCSVAVIGINSEESSFIGGPHRSKHGDPVNVIISAPPALARSSYRVTWIS